MGDISENFSRSEFKCNCNNCKFAAVDVELLEVLEDVRSHFNAPITITSGWRCHDYNALVGGAKDSYHKRGTAADFQVSGVTPLEVYKWLDERYSHKYGIGLYNSWVHLDVRSEKARW